MFIVIFKFFVTVGILAILSYQVNYDRALSVLYDANITLLMLSLVVLLIQVFLSSLRWSVMLEIKKVGYTFLKTLELMWIGLFFNQVLPTGIGGDVVRIHQLNKRCKDMGLSISSVFWDRVIGFMGLGILSFLGVILMVFHTGGSSLVFAGFGVIIILAFATGLIFYLVSRGDITLFGFRVNFNQLYKDAKLFLLEKNNAKRILSLSVASQFLSIVSVYLIAYSIGVFIDILALLIVVPISIIAMAIPVSIAGWGVREGVMVFGFSLFELTAETTLFVSVMYGIQLLLASLPGGIYWITSKS